LNTDFFGAVPLFVFLVCRVDASAANFDVFGASSELSDIVVSLT
jgi:hypothetical protein